ncbi:MAG: hypothetical protein LBE67_19010, partial [Kocuria palustris]|nr:hypothetical protein [Kocuria palustris]
MRSTWDFLLVVVVVGPLRRDAPTASAVSEGDSRPRARSWRVHRGSVASPPSSLQAGDDARPTDSAPRRAPRRS